MQVDHRSLLPDIQDAKAALAAVTGRVDGCGIAGLDCHLGVLPAGDVANPWALAGLLPTLVVRHAAIGSDLQVRWHAHSPLAVQVPGMRLPERSPVLGLRPPWPDGHPLHEPAYEVRVVDPGGLTPSGHDVGAAGYGHGGGPCATVDIMAVTLSLDDVVDCLRRWHRGATEIVSAGPLAPPARSAAAPTVLWDRESSLLSTFAADADLEAIRAGVPRTPAGRLDRKTPLLIAPVDPAAVEARRADWIVARAISAAEVELRVEAVIAANHRHRLDVLRRLRGPDAPGPAELGPDRRAQLELVGRGEVVAALELAGVDLDRRTRLLLSGRRLAWRSSTADEDWPAAARRAFAACAPWLLAGPAWEYVRESCRRRSDGVRVVLLPHQTAQSKGGINLLAEQSRPVLELRWTASNRVLPDQLWMLPAELHSGRT
ncbi:MAG TPA: hypothetical protein VFO60_07510 [Candidatus Dormibacteraeota bacterium]|nr:hypothetical protein [Candidatus Dormibacteraeota bacterium]